MRKYLLPMFLASLDIISVILAAFISIYLRFDSNKIPADYLSLLISYMPLAVAIYLISFYLFKLYGRIWRYASATELIAIVMANIAASTAWYFISLYIGAVLPRSLYVFTGLLLIFFIGGSRLSLRFYSYVMNKPKYRQIQRKKNKVLIIGAGDAGAMLLREIERYHIANRQVVGFIDDDKNKTGKILLGVKVLGTRNELVKLASEKGIDEIIIAMPSVKGKEIKAIISICKETNCKLTILPGLYEIIEGKVSISQLRPVDIEDLLGRDPVKLDNTAVREYLAGKIVLITGAGGSIGSEIVRQVAKMQPKKLLLLGKGENSIYEITQELKINCPEVKTVPIIADIRDKERIKAIMDYFEPQVVFHAAAHKHVPLMEYQPAEAVRNNILGTKVVADEAAAHNVETFVMISTDKAVNPTSVMGCTKRVA
ncbi:SDR family NAD(P)-dependent oxidoreductase, partial [Phascolarctobacterium faecium]